MNMRLIAGLFMTLGASWLTGCNTDENITTPSLDPDEGRYHEKSFSWSETTGPLAKGSALSELASKETRFATADDMIAAVQTLYEKLKDKSFTDSLWKPVDYACDELELAVWNVYGKVVVEGAVVFDEEMLKGRCRPSEAVGESVSETGRLAKVNATSWLGEAGSGWPFPSEVSDRQYPYKMIGTSWSNDYYGVYKSAGGATQFEKRRSKLGVTAWYDTDASRIGIRTYIIDCSTYTPRECRVHKSLSDWNRNDDYVSEREPIIGGGFRNYYPTPNNGLTDVPEIYYPVNYAKKFKVADAALSMHSVDHAGLIFRAMSSYGIGSAPVSGGKFLSYDYVTW